MDLEISLNVALAKRKISKTDLAKKMGVTKTYIPKVVKTGSMSVRKLQELCTALDYKVWEFVKLGEEE